jgi:hypothetical protein
VAVEQFVDLVRRCELEVVARMKVRPGALADTTVSEQLPPIVWAPGRTHSVSKEIDRLEELKTGITYSDSLAQPTE